MMKDRNRIENKTDKRNDEGRITKKGKEVGRVGTLLKKERKSVG